MATFSGQQYRRAYDKWITIPPTMPERLFQISSLSGCTIAWKYVMLIRELAQGDDRHIGFLTGTHSSFQQAFDRGDAATIESAMHNCTHEETELVQRRDLRVVFQQILYSFRVASEGRDPDGCHKDVVLQVDICA